MLLLVDIYDRCYFVIFFGCSLYFDLTFDPLLVCASQSVMFVCYHLPMFVLMSRLPLMGEGVKEQAMVGI